MKCLHPQFIPLSKRLQSAHLRAVGYDVINSASDNLIAVPCGKCIYCRESRAMSLATRIALDWTCKSLLLYYNLYFVTLTYDPIHIHVTADGNSTLCRDDAVQFKNDLYDYFYPLEYDKTTKKMKRKFTDDPDRLEMFICGEYGGHTERPHYHAIIICPLDLNQMTILLHDIWKKGNIQFDDSSSLGVGAVSYVASFHSVKTGLFDYAKLKNAIPQHIAKFVQKVSKDKAFQFPFCLYTRPAIGTFITRCQDSKVLALKEKIWNQDTPYPTFVEPLSNKYYTLPVIDNYIDKMFSPRQLYLRAKEVTTKTKVEIGSDIMQHYLQGENSLANVLHDHSELCEKEYRDTFKSVVNRKL